MEPDSPSSASRRAGSRDPHVRLLAGDLCPDWHARRCDPGSTHLLEGRGGGGFMLVGRMRPGATARNGNRVGRFRRAARARISGDQRHGGAMVIPAAVGFDNPAYVKPGVIVLASALGIFASLVTLIIICANLANLQLSRLASARQEIAIRLSLGCSRGRLTRQMLVESSVARVPER